MAKAATMIRSIDRGASAVRCAWLSSHIYVGEEIDRICAFGATRQTAFFVLRYDRCLDGGLHSGEDTRDVLSVLTIVDIEDPYPNSIVGERSQEMV